MVRHSGLLAGTRLGFDDCELGITSRKCGDFFESAITSGLALMIFSGLFLALWISSFRAMGVLQLWWRLCFVG